MDVGMDRTYYGHRPTGGRGDGTVACLAMMDGWSRDRSKYGGLMVGLRRKNQPGALCSLGHPVGLSSSGAVLAIPTCPPLLLLPAGFIQHPLDHPPKTGVHFTHGHVLASPTKFQVLPPHLVLFLHPIPPLEGCFSDCLDCYFEHPQRCTVLGRPLLFTSHVAPCFLLLCIFGW